VLLIANGISDRFQVDAVSVFATIDHQPTRIAIHQVLDQQPKTLLSGRFLVSAAWPLIDPDLKR
jgi:hypothetical protein